jgi:hypothetical protein
MGSSGALHPANAAATPKRNACGIFVCTGPSGMGFILQFAFRDGKPDEGFLIPLSRHDPGSDRLVTSPDMVA